MVEYTQIGGLKVHPLLLKTIKEEVCAGSEVSPSQFWSSLEEILEKFSHKNSALLKKRDAIQAQIDAYHLEHPKWDLADYTSFLSSIGYLVPQGPDFKIDTTKVDPEISSVAGPQLVVPVDKARFALNAANARWGSLMDAFYGTDAGPDNVAPYNKTKGYNPKRGEKVFEFTHAFLDEFFPLTNGLSHGDVTSYKVSGQKLDVTSSGTSATLQVPEKFVGFSGSAESPTSILLKNNDLHVEILIDRNSSIGKTHKAGVKDVLLEAAVTAICDFEDSVAAVDAFDKSQIYKNWARLMKGTLEESFKKGDGVVHRKLNKDKKFTSPSGESFVLPGRVVLLVRNVGLHMYTNAVKLAKNNADIPEGLLDLLVTAVSSLHDIGVNANAKDSFNSRTGSVYIVKPKQHGPEEVAFTVSCFSAVEKLVGLPENTLKIGIMDEERRTTVNLKECIRAAKNRCIFINTGFMDRTGDEFHTSCHKGVFLPREQVKKAVWLQAYENWNVDVGINCGFIGKAQIGKGMWAAPDDMKDMLVKKINHPEAGANCAWVPSPTAATLHAIHYHKVYVKEVQKNIEKQGFRSSLSDILTPPLFELYQDKSFQMTKEIVHNELLNNAQSILGYVVRWVLMGVGCSKVPDINDVPLMEDRATLRINSQHIANWLHHGVVSADEVMDALKKMAVIVDKQNKGQEGYSPMSGNFESNLGFQCAVELCFNGLDVPNGLTEYSLTKFRLAQKAKENSPRL